MQPVVVKLNKDEIKTIINKDNNKEEHQRALEIIRKLRTKTILTGIETKALKEMTQLKDTTTREKNYNDD